MQDEKENRFVRRADMLKLIANAMNLVSPDIEHHHEMVAYIAYRIANQMNLAGEVIMNMVYAALLHDIGSISREKESGGGNLDEGREFTADIMSGIPGVEEIARIIQYSGLRWDSLHSMADGHAVTLFRQAHIIYIADNVSKMLDPKIPVLLQKEKIIAHLKDNASTVFCPIASQSFFELSRKEEFWFNLLYAPGNLFGDLCGAEMISIEETLSMSKMLSAIVDFRSPFTAMHSAGVSAAAFKLAELMGMNREEKSKMLIAGLLHDLGKLKIGPEILEKAGKLDDDEFAVIKEHPFYTYEILSKVRGFEDIAKWAGYHHERLDGSGYPFHLNEEEIPLGAKIMTCADIFSALAETRPYREGLSKEQTLAILDDNARKGFISKTIVDIIRANYEEIDGARKSSAMKNGARYYKMNFNNPETAEK